MRKYLYHSMLVGLMVGIGIYTYQDTQKKRALVRPSTAAEFAQTSAMIIMTDLSSGGSGVIYKSSEKESVILTNKHVCEVIQAGGLVGTAKKTYKIDSYKLYPKHDLCMVRVLANLKVNTQLAKKRPKLYSHAFVSGHPALLPHVLTEGYFSSSRTIDIAIGMKDCDGSEKPEEMMYCMIFGQVPIIRSFRGQLVTATIMPGSSGSGVFNEDGDISGLVFAGNAQGLSYGFIVPYDFVKDFVDNADKYKWQRPKTGSNKPFFTKFQKSMKVLCTINRSLFSVECDGDYGL
jgi:S1-C subfamily serine protease